MSSDSLKNNVTYKLFIYKSHNIFVCVCVYNHHPNIVLLAWISLTLPRHSSLSSIVSGRSFRLFVAASHQTGLDTRSKARRPIKVGIKGRGRSGTSRDSNPAGLCCSLAHLVQCEPDEARSFTNPNVGPGTYASLRLKLDARSSAIRWLQRRQNCSSPTRK